MRGVIIAGTASGVGKTTVAIGVMAALARRGLRVQPFKAGPDFIDGSYHRLATGRPSRNLDTWLMPADRLQALYSRWADEADCAVIEGVMGLFDGDDAGEGSTAHLAKMLNLPVVLVVDAKGAGASVAAAAYGFERYDPDLTIAGIIVNRVGSPRHAALVTEALRRRGRATVLGCLPRDEALSLPERHLGLVMAEETLTETVLDRLVKTVERHLDLDALLQVMAPANPGAGPHGRGPGFLAGRSRPGPNGAGALPGRPRLAVARDEAFCFYYEDNLDLLREAGADLCPFSPLHDSDLPAGIHGLYIGGGYPELHAPALAKNRALREAIRGAWADGLPIYAECGGLMYLARAIQVLDGTIHDMVGIFPTSVRMLPRRKALGYVEVVVQEACLLAPTGTRLRGHEYHYSELVEDPLATPDCRAVYAVSDRRSPGPRPEGYTMRNALASYIHLHFASYPEAAHRFVASLNAQRDATHRRSSS